MDFENFFLQPMDGPDVVENTELTVRYCLDHPQWRLSLQTHKIVGIRWSRLGLGRGAQIRDDARGRRSATDQPATTKRTHPTIVLIKSDASATLAL